MFSSGQATYLMMMMMMTSSMSRARAIDGVFLLNMATY